MLLHKSGLAKKYIFWYLTSSYMMNVTIVVQYCCRSVKLQMYIKINFQQVIFFFYWVFTSSFVNFFSNYRCLISKNVYSNSSTASLIVYTPNVVSRGVKGIAFKLQLIGSEPIRTLISKTSLDTLLIAFKWSGESASTALLSSETWNLCICLSSNSVQCLWIVLRLKRLM